MELKLLTGGYTAESSNKAAEDDQLEEVLEKYGSTGKSDNRKILTKENAQEAAVEYLEQKMGLETMDAMDNVKTIFTEVWNTHDVLTKGNIDFNEGYTLMQDLLARETDIKK